VDTPTVPALISLRTTGLSIQTGTLHLFPSKPPGLVITIRHFISTWIRHVTYEPVSVRFGLWSSCCIHEWEMGFELLLTRMGNRLRVLHALVAAATGNATSTDLQLSTPELYLYWLDR
jgi:hypothetical protein